MFPYQLPTATTGTLPISDPAMGEVAPFFNGDPYAQDPYESSQDICGWNQQVQQVGSRLFVSSVLSTQPRAPGCAMFWNKEGLLGSIVLFAVHLRKWQPVQICGFPSVACPWYKLVDLLRNLLRCRL